MVLCLSCSLSSCGGSWQQHWKGCLLWRSRFTQENTEDLGPQLVQGEPVAPSMEILSVIAIWEYICYCHRTQPILLDRLSSHLQVETQGTGLGCSLAKAISPLQIHPCDSHRMQKQWRGNYSRTKKVRQPQPREAQGPSLMLQTASAPPANKMHTPPDIKQPFVNC